MNSNMKKSGLGKYAGVHGVVFKNSVQPAAVSKGVIGKGGGKTCNAPMDSDAEFEKRLKRYERQRQAAAEAAVQANLQQAENARRLSLPKIPGFGGFRSKTLPHFFAAYFLVSGLFLRNSDGRYNRRCF